MVGRVALIPKPKPNARGTSAPRGAKVKAAKRMATGAMIGAAIGFAGHLTHVELSQAGTASAADPSKEYEFPNDLKMHGNFMSMRAFQSGFMNSSAVANLAGLSGLTKAVAGLFDVQETSITSIGSITSQRGVVRLPLPANLSNDLDPTYSESSLTAAFAGAVSAGAGAVLNKASAATPKAAGQAAAVGAAAAAATNLALGAYAKTINPMNVVLFTGMPFRQYSYTWKLSPRNKDESDKIRDLVRYLQWCSVPAYFAGGVLLDYPHYFQISIYKDSYLQKFQPAVIERINVNYHGQGAFYKRGDSNQSDPAPAEVELQINFKEVIIVTKDNLNSGGEGPG
jgi:hypothetical protein